MARQFPFATGNFISLPNSSALTGGSQMSAAIWYKVGVSPGGNGQSQIRIQPGSTFFVLMHSPATTPDCILDNDGGVGGGPQWNTSILYDGNWHHMAMTWTQNGTFAIYTDGVVTASRAAANVALSNLGSGWTISANAEPTNGSLADGAVWSAALTTLEIAGLANGRRPYQTRPKSLVYWLPLDGLQSPEPDLSGNAMEGTLNGTCNSVFGPPILPITAIPKPLFTPTPAGAIVQGWTASMPVTVSVTVKLGSP